ncbi:hypothetical protein ACIGW8_15125 [Streptomyces sioyaensis]|uniref:hypothetical protein n=1 Tax=Streptomyces sioyaensis TaxID=67364 RepID=UPI0037D5BCBD
MPLVLNPNNLNACANFSVTANSITAPGAASATFSYDARTPQTFLVVGGSAGPATFQAVGSGQQTVTATYLNAAGAVVGTETATVTVNPAPAGVLAASLANVGGATQATATLSCAGDPAALNGTVEYTLPGGVIVSTPVVNGVVTPVSLGTQVAGGQSVAVTFVPGTGCPPCSFSTLVVSVCSVTVQPLVEPVIINQPTLLTANLSCNGSPVAGGNITFTDSHGNNLGNSTTNSAGVATLTATFTTLGPSEVTATASTTSSCSCSGVPSLPRNFTVQPPPCVVVLQPPSSPVTTGTTVPLVATVLCSGTAVANATVDFTDQNGTVLGSATTNAGGTATLPHVFTTPGPVTVTVTASAAPGSTSCACTNVTASASFQVVAGPTCTVTLQQPTGPVFVGEPTVLTTRVRCDGTPVVGATVVLTDQNGNTLGTGTTDSAGLTDVTVTFTSTGPFHVTATVAGNPPGAPCDCTNVASLPVTLTPTQRTCTVTVLAALTPVVANEQSFLRALVTCDGSTVTGATVTLTDSNGNTLGTATTDSAGFATVPVVFPASDVGTVQVTATATGGSGQGICTCTGQTSQPVNVTVLPPNSCVVVSQAPQGPVFAGQTAQLSASVLCAGTPVVGANVTFTDQNGNVLGTGTTDATGIATTSVTFATAGSVTVTATATATGTNCTCSNTPAPPILVTVLQPGVCTVTLLPPTGTVLAGQATVLQAVVLCNGAAVSGASVTFTDSGGNTLGTGTTNAAGLASTSVTFPASGSVTVTATASGGTSPGGACSCTNVPSSPVTIAVVPPNSCAVVLQPLQGPVVVGQAVSVSALVLCNGAAVGGASVTFTDQNGTVLGTATTNAAGMATAPVAFSAVGSVTVTATATASGTGCDCTGVQSGPLTVDVVPPQTCTVSLFPVSGPAVVGQAVSVSALVLCNGTAVTGATVAFADASGTTVGTATTNAAGLATASVTFTIAGPNSLTATATAPGGSTSCTCTNVASPTVPVTVLPPNSCLVLTQAPQGPVFAGQTTQLSASVLCAGTPVVGANVTFTDQNGNVLGTGTTDATGIATTSVTFATAGSVTVTATATATGTSCSCSNTPAPPVLVTVLQPGVCTVTLLPPTGTVLAGQATVLRAVVLCNGAAVSGSTVTFSDSGGNTLGTGTTDATGTATVSVTFPASGSVTVTATASGGTSPGSACSCTDVPSSPVTIAVVPPNSCAVVLQRVLGSVVVGQPVQLSAQVLCNGVAVSGASVTFTDNNGNVLGTGTSNAAGTATASVSFPTAGPVTVTATATASGTSCDCTGVQSGPVTVDVVNRNSCAVSVFPVLGPVVVGTPVSVSALVLCNGAPVVGATVTLSDSGGNPLATATTNPLGVATTSVTFTTAGPNSVTATATAPAGSTACDCTGVASVPVPVTVTQANQCAVVLQPVLAPVVVGQPVQLSAQVLCNGAAVGGASVSFADSNGTVLGTATTNAAGTATVSVTFTTAGPNSVTATATAPAGSTACDCTNVASVPVQVTAVQANQCAVVLQQVLAPVVVGQPVQLSAQVLCNGAAVGGASVSFADSNGTVLGTATTNAAGTASVSATFSTAGPVTVTATATATGTNCDCTSVPSNPVTVDVGPNSCTVSVFPVQGPVVVGTPVAVSALVLCNGTPVVGATVNLSDSGGNPLGTATTNAAGVATASVTFTAAGANSVTATAASSGSTSCDCRGVASVPVQVVVTSPNSCAVVLQPVPAPVVVGQPVQLSAQVLCNGATVGGASVTFTDQNGNVLGTGTSNAAGTATASVTFPTAGPVTVTATATASGTNCDCTNVPSNPVTISVVSPNSCTVSVFPVQGPVVVGTPVSVSALVLCNGAAVGGATVTFSDSGGNTLGTATTNPLGVATTSVTFTTAGSNSLTATATAPAGSTTCQCTDVASFPVQVVVVQPHQCAVVLQQVLGPVVVGQPVQLSAQVLCNGAAVSGASVNFTDGNGNVLGTATTNAAGTASVSATFSTAGPVTVTATATATGTNCDCTNVPSNPVTVDVTGPNTCTVSLFPVQGPVVVGQPVSVSALVLCNGAAVNGATVTFSDSAGNPLATATTNPLGVATATVTFTTSGPNSLTATATAPAGSTTCQCTDVASVPVQVTVTPAHCAVTVLPPTTPVVVGQPATVGVQVHCGGAPVLGATVTLTDSSGNVLGTGTTDASGLASVSVTFSTAGNVTLTATATGGTSAGGVCSCSGEVSAPVTLSVVQPPSGPVLIAEPACWRCTATACPDVFTTTLRAKLLPATANVKVEFFVGKEFVGSALTDATGVATVQTSLSAKEIQHRSYKAVATMGTATTTGQPVKVKARGTLRPCCPPCG